MVKSLIFVVDASDRVLKVRYWSVGHLSNSFRSLSEEVAYICVTHLRFCGSFRCVSRLASVPAFEHLGYLELRIHLVPLSRPGRRWN